MENSTPPPSVLEEWLENAFNTVVFCRYIETAKYLGTHLGPVLRKKHAKLDLKVVRAQSAQERRGRGSHGGLNPRVWLQDPRARLAGKRAILDGDGRTFDDIATERRQEAA